MAENLSNVPPIVTLSGIPGVGSFSGTGQSDLSGTGSNPLGGLFGMTGGPDLLSQLLAQAGQSGTDGSSLAAGLGLGQSLAAPSFSQGGGLGAGSFSQQGGDAGGTVAGQTAGGGSAGGSVGSNTDPFSIAAKVLGLGQRFAGLVNQGQTASPTQGTGTVLDQRSQVPQAYLS